jgi:hypothetical protein
MAENARVSIRYLDAIPRAEEEPIPATPTLALSATPKHNRRSSALSSDICPGCGMRDLELRFEQASSSTATCPACGTKTRLLRLPLFLITGASGAGKSTVCGLLPDLLAGCVTLEMDVLWRREFLRAPGEEMASDFYDVWLRLAKAINQSARPTVLCGTALPGTIEALAQRRYFSDVSYLALVCDDDTLEARLRARPAWRFHDSDPSEVISRMLGFNRWLKENATRTAPPMELLDTSPLTPEETARRAAAWVRASLGGRRPGRD